MRALAGKFGYKIHKKGRLCRAALFCENRRLEICSKMALFEPKYFHIGGAESTESHAPDRKEARRLEAPGR